MAKCGYWYVLPVVVVVVVEEVTLVFFNTTKITTADSEREICIT